MQSSFVRLAESATTEVISRPEIVGIATLIPRVNDADEQCQQEKPFVFV